MCVKIVYSYRYSVGEVSVVGNSVDGFVRTSNLSYFKR
jgi:hypothetical protein